MVHFLQRLLYKAYSKAPGQGCTAKGDDVAYMTHRR